MCMIRYIYLVSLFHLQSMKEKQEYHDNITCVVNVRLSDFVVPSATGRTTREKKIRVNAQIIRKPSTLFYGYHLSYTSRPIRSLRLHKRSNPMKIPSAASFHQGYFFLIQIPKPRERKFKKFRKGKNKYINKRSFTEACSTLRCARNVLFSHSVSRPKFPEF